MNTHEQIATIQSVDELITALDEEDRQNYAEIIRDIDLPIRAFDQFCSWSSESYTRNCIACSDKYELILLCWERGQDTPIHDHGGEECWVRVIKGVFKETIYKFDESDKLYALKTTRSEKGDITYMKDFMGYHRLENVHIERSMTLHLYAKPILNCQLFDETLNEFVRKEMAYDTVSDLVLNTK